MQDRQDYVILRISEPSAVAAPLGGVAVGGTTEATVEAATLDAAEAAAIASQPGMAVAPVFATTLVAPVSNNVAATNTWGVDAIGALASTSDGTGVVVGVLDTGIDSGHAAFVGVTLIEQDFSRSGNGDVHGHGTHCAGTVFGRSVGGTRIGVAPGVTQALIAKVLDDTGSGDTMMLVDGLLWAHRQGARVISMSLGFDFPGQVARLTQQGYPVAIATSMALEGYRANMRMFDAVMGVIRAAAPLSAQGGCVVVAASGNESRRDANSAWSVNVSLPAAADHVVAVGAVGQSAAGLIVPGFSNAKPTLVAPGVAVQSARAGGGLVGMTGTSMACPHVAGAAALWWQHHLNLGYANPDLVVAGLLANANASAIPGASRALIGAGLVACP